MLRTFLEIVTIFWLCIEIGTFIEQRIPLLGSNTLFWPFWLIVFVALIMLVHILDLRYSHRGQVSRNQSDLL